MTAIPLVDLRAQYHQLKAEIDAAIAAVLERGQFVLGPEVEAFEGEMAAYGGTRHAIGVASGTDALELALRACGVGPRDEVITTALSFFATVEAIIAVGATPTFVDVEPVTYTVNPAHVAAKITPKTKALIPVHLYGHPCGMDQLLPLAKAHQLKVIEDCAQAIGAEWAGTRVGGFGDAGCLSFYPTKNLAGYGDGGMVVTNDDAVAERIRVLRVHGSRQRYTHELIGKNSRLDELQAAVLRVKLRHLEAWTEARRRHAERYTRAFHAAGAQQITLPRERPGYRHVYHLYAIRLPHRDQVQELLAKHKIESQVCYPSTLPAQPALKPWAIAGRFPIAEAVTSDILALPMYPELTPPLIDEVVHTVLEGVRSR
jgi:dTDP-4-amino-4,6-dideoxygalactose transaminase